MSHSFKKIVSSVTLFIYLFGLGAQAQIIADPYANKNQRPHVINGGNGTPIVNIQTPTQGGISVNHYQQFDVDQKGVILNNSRQSVNTQLGGMVQGNDWLATGSARAIVNQINSQNPSHLNGFIEVAGQKADVIIANPSGININGSGFINAGKVTITTGTPMIQGGQLQRFEIRGGTINILGNGLNNQGADYTQILSEVVNIQAGVWAKDLEVIAGNFDVDMKGEITKYVKKDSKAKVAIDTGALGGMYAGKIKLVSTDKGVGVNHAGQAFATVNGFSLSADGKLTNTGTIVAQNKVDNKAAKVSIKAQKIENRGSISSQGQQTLKAAEITNHGLIVSSHELIINNGTTLTNTDQAEMRGARLEITSNRLINSGKITQTGAQDLAIESAQLVNNNGGKIGYIVEKPTGSTAPTEEIEITPPTGSTGSAGGTVNVESAPPISQPIQWAAGSIVVGDALINDGGTVSANGGVSLVMNHSFINDHSELYLNNLTVQGDVLSNVQGKIIANTANLTVKDFYNQKGSLVTEKSGTISAVNLYNEEGKIASVEDLTFNNHPTQSLKIDNKNGEITTGGQLTIDASTLSGDGTIASVQNIAIALQESFTNYKNLVAGGNIVISTLKDVINHADIEAGDTLKVTANNFENVVTGNLITGKQIQLSIDEQFTNRGSLNSGLTQITTKNLENIGTGKIYGDIININASNIFNLNETVDGKAAAAVIGAREHLALGAKNILNKDESLLLSGNTLMMGGSVDQNHQTVGNAETLYNRSARIEALGDAKIAVNHLWNLNDHFQKELLKDPVEQKDIPASFTWLPGGSITQYYGSQEFIDALLSGQEMEFTLNCGDGSGKFCTDYNKGMMAYMIWDDKGNAARGDAWLLKNHTISKYEETIINSKPAEIIIGGNLIAEGEHWINSDSRIIVGKDLIANDLVKLDNLETLKQSYTTDVGSVVMYTPANGQNTITANGPFPINQKSPITEEHFVNSPMVFEQNAAVKHGNLNNDGKNAQVDSESIQNGLIKTLSNYNQSLPTSSLFTINPNGQNYLIETDSRFTNYKKWLGSDYMLKQLATSPENMHKRLGDGYYEQRLINEQVNTLTGYRRLGGYGSDEEQYQALMNAGLTVASALNLTVGVALTAEQVARLTSDIVWLETTTVTLPDGRVETVLVPKVYVVAREGDLSPTGALISGDNLKLNLSGDLNNQGTLAGRKIVNIQGQNINNSGMIAGQNIQLSADNAVNIMGGSVMADGNLFVKGNAVNVVTTTATAGDQTNGSTVVNRVAGLYVKNTADGILSVSAEQDVNLQGAVVSNAAKAGKTQLVSKTGSVNIGTVNVESHESVGDGQNYHREHRTGEVGSLINVANDLTIVAGNDVTIRQSELNSEDGKIAIHATNDVNIVEGRETRDTDIRATYSSKKLLSSKSGVYEGSSQRDDGVGSIISGKDIQITADHDVLIRGSDVISDDSTRIIAKNDLTITTAENSYSEEVKTQNKKSGFMSAGGGIGFTVGSVKETLDRNNTDVTNTGSTVGSLKGNTVLQAGNSYTQKGSMVASPEGDILIQAKDVNIVAAEDTYNSDYRYTREQKGLTVAINVPVVNAVQDAVDAAKTVGKSKNDRVNAMAVVNTGWSAYSAGKAAGNISEALGQNAANPTNISANITYGQSKSESTSHTEGSNAVQSSVNAGGKVVIQATGAGENSNINIVGSDVAGKGGTYLIADNQVNIVAAEQYSQERSQNKSSGWNAGVSISDRGIGITVGGNKGKGHANGDDITYRYSHVGDLNSQTVIQSGGATNIIGGQVYGKGVKIDADELNVVSLQDRSTYDSKQKDVSGSLTVGTGVSGSASYNKSKIHSDYVSANEQSGVYAGDDGFNINVNNNTNLVGGIITSTEKAEAEGKNSFTTGTLTSTDLNNYSNYNASGVGIGAGISVGGSDQPQKDNTITEKIPLMDTGPTGVSKSVGYGKDKGNATSTTNSGIYTSNITITDADKQKELTGKTVEQTIADIQTNINTDLAMEYQGLENIFDKDKVQKEIDLQVSVTQAFDKNRQEMKLEINQKIDQAKEDKDSEAQAKWELVGKILDSVSAGLYAPTESIGGSLVAAASPELANQIGQYFKGKMVDGELSTGDNIAHKLAHGILGAAVAAATGQDVTNGFLAGAGGEILGEAVTKWLYPDVKDPSTLTPEQKNLVSSIVGLGTAGLGLATGNGTTDVATGGMIGQNAVENNFLTGKKPLEYAKKLDDCKNNYTCRDNVISEIAVESAKNIEKLEQCWNNGDLGCVDRIKTEINAAEDAYYYALAKQDPEISNIYRHTNEYYADIINNCSDKCGWLESMLLKTASETVDLGLYALFAGDIARSNSKKDAVIKNKEGNQNQQYFENKFPEHKIERPNIAKIEDYNGIRNTASGKLNYVIDGSGKMIIGKSGHIDLSGGKPVLAAGEVSFHAGKIKYIDNASGHYQPPKSIKDLVESAFEKAGFESQGKFVPKVWVVNKKLPRGGSWKIEN